IFAVALRARARALGAAFLPLQHTIPEAAGRNGQARSSNSMTRNGRVSAPGLLALALVLASPVDPAAAQTPRPTNPLALKGWEILNSGKVDEALAMLEKAAEADANDPFAHAWLGVALVRKGGIVEPAEAPAWVKKGFNAMDEVVELHPNVYVGYLARGVAAVKVPDLFKKAPAAVEDLKKVLAMKQQDAASVPEEDMPAVYLTLRISSKKPRPPPLPPATLHTPRHPYP